MFEKTSLAYLRGNENGQQRDNLIKDDIFVEIAKKFVLQFTDWR